MAIVRFTRQRQAVLEAVQASNLHPDASRVFEDVRLMLPSISLGTVYRSLEALVNEGHLMKIQQPGQATRYDARLERHCHLVCDACGEVFDVLLELPEPKLPAQALGPELLGFQVRSTQVEFHGLCADCVTLTQQRAQHS